MVQKNTISYLLTFLLLICFVLPGTVDAAELPKEEVKEKSSETSDECTRLIFTCDDNSSHASNVIKVFDKDGKVVYEGKMDNRGICSWNEAEYGKYYLKEIQIVKDETSLQKKYFFELTDGKINGASKATFGKITASVDLEFNDIKADKDSVEDNTENDPNNMTMNEVTDNRDGKNAEMDEVTAEGDKRPDEKAPTYPVNSLNVSTTCDDPVSMLNDDKAVTESITEGDILVVITDTAEDDKENDQPIQNAEFTIYDKNDEEVYRGLTDIDGELMCYLPAGSYTMKQTFIPDGYISASDDLAFTVTSNGSVVGDVDIVNKFDSNAPLNSKEGYKSDTVGEVQVDLIIFNENVITGNAVIGAEVSIEDNEGKVVKQEHSDKDGKVTFEKLKPADYTIYQSAAADGYYKSSDRIEISVDEKGRVSGDSNRTLSSTPQGMVVITVEDKSSGGVIEGVLLSIRNEQGESVYSGETNANGSVAFVVPELGRYTVNETTVPNDYLLNTSSYNFTVKDGFEIQGTTTITNSKVSSGITSVSNAGDHYSPGSSSTGSDSKDITDTNVEGVPQTGVADYTAQLVVVSIALLIIAIGAFFLEQYHINLFQEKIFRKGGNSHGKS